MRGHCRAVVCLLLLSTEGAACVACSQAGRPSTPSPSEWTRVIVVLRLPPSETDEQKGRLIGQTREALLAELKATPHRVVRIYETIPAVALDVSPQALLVLRKSTLVAGVEEDRLAAPQ